LESCYCSLNCLERLGDVINVVCSSNYVDVYSVILLHVQEFTADKWAR
jgi:hypothetical protein